MAWADSVVADVRRASGPIMSQFGARVVEDVRESIGVLYPPASMPGTPPHLRQGLLYDGVGHTQEHSADGITEIISSSRDERAMVPEYLEYGTDRMQPRPYMHPARERAADDVSSYMQDHLKL